MTTLCRLVAEVGEDARFPDLARDWFTGVLDEVLPDMGAGLAAGPVLYKRDKRDAGLDVLWGEPDAVYAELQVTKKPDGPIARWVRYTPTGWRRFLDGLGQYPYGAVIAIVPLDGLGRPVSHEGVADVRVTRLDRAPQWATFSFSAGAGVAEPARVVGRWAAFARQRAESMRAVYGDIGGGISRFTLLEYATRARPKESIQRARSQLRGYSWATLVPPELVGELGGIGALRQAGVFHQVDELDYGAAWLQATADPAGYDEQAARRVFDVLAPVLIGGRSRRTPNKHQPALAFDVDADDFRSQPQV